MKKYSWIMALLLALSLAFFGCGGGNGDDDDDDKDKDKEDGKVVNPIVDGASFLKISGRSENWHSIDIRAGKDSASGNFTADKSHTITVYGSAPKGTNQIRFANTDSPYGVHGTAVP